MQNMKNQGGDKRMKQVESRKKKLERTGVTKNENGHRWTQQNAGSGMKKGSINSLLRLVLDKAYALGFSVFIFGQA